MYASPSHILLPKKDKGGKGRKEECSQHKLLCWVLPLEDGREKEGSRDIAKLACQHEGREVRCNSTPGTQTLRKK